MGSEARVGPVFTFRDTSAVQLKGVRTEVEACIIARSNRAGVGRKEECSRKGILGRVCKLMARRGRVILAGNNGFKKGRANAEGIRNRKSFQCEIGVPLKNLNKSEIKKE